MAGLLARSVHWGGLPPPIVLVPCDFSMNPSELSGGTLLLEDSSSNKSGISFLGRGWDRPSIDCRHKLASNRSMQFNIGIEYDRVTMCPFPLISELEVGRATRPNSLASTGKLV